MKLQIIKGDITKESTDVIVNAANEELRPGGGVDAAITKAAGSAALVERKELGSCETGDAVIATAGNLDAKYIIYAVGPKFYEKRDNLLASAYRRSIQLAIEHNCASISFPAISAGVYGYPADVAVQIAIDTFCEFKGIDFTIRFVIFTDEIHDAARSYLSKKIREISKD